MLYLLIMSAERTDKLTSCIAVWTADLRPDAAHGETRSVAEKTFLMMISYYL